MSKARSYTIGALGFLFFAAGGPAFMYYIRPTDEELFARFSPAIKKQNLENRDRREKEFEEFVGKLKEYSKSDKPIWVVAAQEEKRRKAEMETGRSTRLLDEGKVRDELRSKGATWQAVK